jgi:hypothetical protein
MPGVAGLESVDAHVELVLHALPARQWVYDLRCNIRRCRLNPHAWLCAASLCHRSSDAPVSAHIATIDSCCVQVMHEHVVFTLEWLLA